MRKGLWRADAPLVLASKSTVRHLLLEAAGIPVEIRPAGIDERAIERAAPAGAPEEIARLLAREKARGVAEAMPDRIVVGADQLLTFGGQRLSKPGNRDAARAQLRALRGRSHQLHSAVAVCRGQSLRYEHAETATLTMRDFSDDFLECYLDEAGDAVTESVGSYQLERAGIQLFDSVEGDYFAILGLPLLPLLKFLRAEGFLA